MSTLKERLILASPEWPRGKKAALAKHCGVKASSVSDWISGETKTLEGDNLLRAAEFLGVIPKWLASGRGPMTDDEPASEEMQGSGSTSSAADAVYILSEALLEMPPASRERAATLLSSMARDPEGQWAEWLAAMMAGAAKGKPVETVKTDRDAKEGKPPSNSSNSAPTIEENVGAVAGSSLKNAFKGGDDFNKSPGAPEAGTGDNH